MGSAAAELAVMSASVVFRVPAMQEKSQFEHDKLAFPLYHAQCCVWLHDTAPCSCLFLRYQMDVRMPNENCDACCRLNFG